MSFETDASPAEPQPLPVSKAPLRWSRLAPLLVGGALVVGGGVFALTALQGGGGSPEDPVKALFQAIDDEDVIGMLESLTAPERDALLDPAQRLAGELRRIGVADDRFDLRGLEGVDFQVTDLELESTELSDDLAEVRITGGQITATVSPDQLPIGADLRQAVEDAGGDLSETPQPEITDLAGSDDPFLVARHDGRWGVSLGYTIAESTRRNSDAPLPDFGSSEIDPLGADTPEGAVEGFMAAIDDGDVRGVIGHVDPEEMAALYDYAPLFLPELEGQVDLPALARQLTINDLQLTAEGEGDTRRVTITALDAIFEPVGGDRMVLRFTDGCWEVETAGPSGPDLRRLCAGELPEAAAPLLEGLIDPSALTEITSGVEVHEADGEWYVSPARTILGGLVGALGVLSDDAIPALVELATSGGMLGGN
jgi:hypothetical protein